MIIKFLYRWFVWILCQYLINTISTLERIGILSFSGQEKPSDQETLFQIGDYSVSQTSQIICKLAKLLSDPSNHTHF